MPVALNRCPGSDMEVLVDVMEHDGASERTAMRASGRAFDVCPRESSALQLSMVPVVDACDPIDAATNPDTRRRHS